MDRCLVCRSDRVRTILDLGPQPVSTHYARLSAETGVEHDLRLAVCTNCGMVQLAKPFPHGDLVSPYDWIAYNEPESHLDAVVDKICRLSGLKKDAAICGTSVKDRTTLDRLRARGFGNTYLLELPDQNGATGATTDVAAIQALLTPSKAAEIVASRGPFDLVIVRHLVEHAARPWAFLEALGTLLAPDGYLVIEVPDCRLNLERQDYTMIWEEHVLYFTPETMPQILAPGGCEPHAIDVYPLPFEDVIVLYARKAASRAEQSHIARTAVDSNQALARRYADAFDHWSATYRRLFRKLTGDGRRLAAYGAGHLTCAFLNFHGLAEHFAFVVDDTPQKQGLFLPKCRLPIVPRSSLSSKEVSVCLFGLAPELEDRIIKNNAAFMSEGGEFYSLLVDSSRSIRTLAS
jgi:SAM-dependent methyltransferase